MATPPEQTSRPAYGYTAGSSLDLARLPIPGNAEFLIYVIVLIVFGLIALFDDGAPGAPDTTSLRVRPGSRSATSSAVGSQRRPACSSSNGSGVLAGLARPVRAPQRAGESWPSAVTDGR